MSSTYSPDLRIELIGTGDQAGVWGNTTNNNLGTFIENAVAGYTSVSIIASPQALTANDGAVDEARFAAIALTTTTSANFTVCIPPNSKLYTFYNASSYVATISNSTVKNGTTLSGGTTVVIPSGKTVSVWSDGTNVAAQSNHLPSLTLASALPVTSGGTGVTTAAAITSLVGNLLFPVGSIYTNASVATNPGTLLGFGTWTAFGAGRVAVGFDSGNTLFDTAEETGGYADATLVSHTHTATSSFSGTALGNHSHTITDSGHSHTGGTKRIWDAASGYYGTNSGAGNDDNVLSRIVGGGQLYSLDYTSTATTGITGTNNASAGTPAGSVSTSNSTEGSTATNKNYQPYITVYMWKRTA